MEKKQPLVSVIVPVYNVEAYLAECVESVRNQTDPELEIILVDDGSTDGSGRLCDALAAQDARIRVIHKENGGQAEARNVGIESAHGIYLYFLDSDDGIRYQNTLKIMVEACESSGADAAFAPLQDVASLNAQPRCFSVGESPEILSREETMSRMLLHEGIGHCAGGAFFRREVWTGLEFPKGKIYEDYAVLYQAVERCEKAVVFSEPMYNYRIRSGSTMKKKITEKNLILLEIGESVTKQITQAVPDLSEKAEYLQLVTYLKLLKGILDGGFGNYPEAQKRIVSFVREHRSLVCRSWAKKADRIKVETLLLNKHLFYWVYELGERRNQKKLES